MKIEDWKGIIVIALLVITSLFIVPVAPIPTDYSLSLDSELYEDIVFEAGNIIEYMDAPYAGGLCNSSETFDYVIITGESLKNNWSELISHRQTFNNFECNVVTVSDINSCQDYWNSNSTFNDSAAQVREFCKDAYSDWNTEFILLGGDWDSNNQVVPYRKLVAHNGGAYTRYPSDVYYSNLGGNWRHNGLWGIPGGDYDITAELKVGRLPVSSSVHIDNIVEKIKWYELEADYQFSSSVGFFGGNLHWPFVTSARYMEGIRQGRDIPSNMHVRESTGFTEWNRNHNKLQQFDISTRLYHANGVSIPSDFIDAINSSKVCFINHISHGSNVVSLDMALYYINALQNTKYGFVYSQECRSGSYHLGGASVEYWTIRTNDSGMFGCILNTGNGLGNSKSTNGTSQFVMRMFWDYMLTDTDRYFGSALAYAHDEAAKAIFEHPSWYKGWAWYGAWYGSHLFCDPAVKLKIREMHSDELTTVQFVCDDPSPPPPSINFESQLESKNHLIVFD